LIGLVVLVWVASATPIRVEVPSTIDDQPQPVDVYPAEGDEGPRPLLVVLHNWSADLDRFDGSEWVPVAAERSWHMIFPDFRGANNRPEACGSMLARQDVLDAVDYMITHYDVDTSRIYLAGVSGGGHMAMVMATHAPDRWAAVSAWAGISDLAAWHAETKAANRKYWRDIEAVVGGAPGDSPEVDAELRLRSPVHHLANAKDLPVEIAAGIHDGYTGSVPIHHSIDAFNAIARALDETPVGAATIQRLSQKDYAEPPEFVDDSYGRGIHLRQTAGASRVTIFEGGHEGIPAAAAAWMAQHARDAN
jgi:poly(3-hydroxybutyrate) depolymerase